MREPGACGEIPNDCRGSESDVTGADVAQLVEHSLGKGEVTSSILVIGSRIEVACCDRVED